jgi:hypothetical protein
MQKDTHLTFREIHGSSEAVLTSIREIQEIALYRKPPDQSLSLRFLSLAAENLPDYQQQPEIIFLRLSPLIPIPGPYLTISYTWQRSGSTADKPPQYVVLRPDATSFQVAPELNRVIHRTLRFAAHQCIHYFWLDQLCVDQTDRSDVENHLQCMNRVYAESQCALAPLCIPILDQWMLAGLTSNLDDLRTAELSAIECIVATLEHLVQDTWFWRTWTYHERLCARSVYLAIPLHGIRSEATDTRDCFAIEDDLIINIEHIQQIIQVSRKNDKVPGGKAPPSPAREQARRLWVLFREFFVERTIITGNTNPIFWNRYIMKAIDRRDNLVVSDRLAIHSNIRNHNWRLRTTQLQNARYSYSTCLLVLVLSNYLLFNYKLSREHFRLPMDQTIMEVIGKMEASEQLSLIHKPPTSEGETVVVFPLWTEEFLEKVTRESEVDVDVWMSGEGTRVVRKRPEGEVSLLPPTSKLLRRGASRQPMDVSVALQPSVLPHQSADAG